MLSSALQYLNALGPIDFILSGSVRFFKLTQPLKAFAPIVLMPSGIIAEVSSTPANAFAAMAVTLPSSGITLCKTVHDRFFLNVYKAVTCTAICRVCAVYVYTFKVGAPLDCPVRNRGDGCGNGNAFKIFLS